MLQLRDIFLLQQWILPHKLAALYFPYFGKKVRLGFIADRIYTKQRALNSNYFPFCTKSRILGCAALRAKWGVPVLYKIPHYPVTLKSLSSFVSTLFAAAIDENDNLSVPTTRKFVTNFLTNFAGTTTLCFESRTRYKYTAKARCRRQLIQWIT